MRRTVNRMAGQRPVIEVSAIVGCALGLMRATLTAHQRVSPCRLAHPAGPCVGHALAAAVRPYIAHAIGGLIAGALLAIGFILLRKLVTKRARPTVDAGAQDAPQLNGAVQVALARVDGQRERAEVVHGMQYSERHDAPGV